MNQETIGLIAAPSPTASFVPQGGRSGRPNRRVTLLGHGCSVLRRRFTLAGVWLIAISAPSIIIANAITFVLSLAASAKYRFDQQDWETPDETRVLWPWRDGLSDGGHLAQKAGHSVTVYNRNAEKSASGLPTMAVTTAPTARSCGRRRRCDDVRRQRQRRTLGGVATTVRWRA